jgi:hypothetical protein
MAPVSLLVIAGERRGFKSRTFASCAKIARSPANQTKRSFAGRVRRDPSEHSVTRYPIEANDTRGWTNYAAAQSLCCVASPAHWCRCLSVCRDARGGPRRGSPIELLTPGATGTILKFEAPPAPMGMAVAMCTLSLLGVATGRMGEARGTAMAEVEFASAVGVSYALVGLR